MTACACVRFASYEHGLVWSIATAIVAELLFTVILQ